ncbi:MAG TPA: URC4/urg3 family protein [Cyanophyceae cyanobacterium]
MGWSSPLYPKGVTLNKYEQQAIAYLRTPLAIRERCDRLFTLACSDQLHYFRCNLTQLDSVANYVIEVMRHHYPDLDIPFHSRWRHFEVGNVPRLAELEQKLAELNPLEKAQTKFDLAVVSVLLDAGAGANWQYHEQETGLVFSRSEGLAVASFRMFCQGMFSSNPKRPLQADAQGLRELTLHRLMQGFQVSSANPLLGVEGRLELLQRLGQALNALPRLFGHWNARPGHLVNYLLEQSNPSAMADREERFNPNPTLPWVMSGVAGWGLSRGTLQELAQVKNQLAASTVFQAVLEGLGTIWPGRLAIAGVNLGDVWFHPILTGYNSSDRYVPFHKLSQWLTYSLLEPLQELGLEITGLDELTGLAEYRNGGLCLDLGLLEVKDTAILQERHLPGSEVIVEWRALTISLLDQIAATIRQKLHLSPDELPLVKVLQGGTWTAGRQVATQRREGGVPPIQLESDGTVF